MTPKLSPLHKALEDAYRAIRARHPDVPEALVSVSAVSHAGKVTKRGHWSPERWEDHEDRETKHHEIILSAETLQNGAAAFEVLIHEAAHGIANAREIADTSRDGRYHNRRYKALAEEVGLTCEKLGTYGYTDTRLTDALRETYAPQIAAIDEALRAHRLVRKGQKKPSGTIALTCSCGRKVRVSRGEVAKGAIYCGLCESEYLPTL